MRKAFRKGETAEAWIKEWMLDIPTQTHYLAKLGYAKTMEVKGRADTDAWVSELASLSDRLPAGPELKANPMMGVAGGRPPGATRAGTPPEMLVVARARLLAEKVRAHGYKAFLAGVGNSNLAAWLAAYQLKQDGCEVELMAEGGFVGYLPR